MPITHRILPWLLAALLGADASQASVLSPRVRWAAATLAETRVGEDVSRLLTAASWPGNPRTPGAEPSIRVLVTTDDPTALPPAGFQVGAVAGDVATVTVPLSRLDALASCRGVRRVELSLPVTPLLDVSRAEIRAQALHGSAAPPYPPSGLTGQGVVVGIIDSGIDTRHADFRNADGTTRLIALWDQTDQIGPHPSPYGYGTVWSPASITANQSRQRDYVGHGTHVAGIAAGNGRARTPNIYAGIAPEAELAVVNARFDDASILDAVEWIQTVAGSRPSVINMSLGSQFGPHDGTADLDRALRARSGSGRILVAAAGNDGGSDIHAEVTVAAGATEIVQFSILNYTPTPGRRNDVLSVEAWTPSASFEVRVSTPGGTTVGPVSGNSRSEALTNDGFVQLEQEVFLGNGERHVFLDSWDQDAAMPPGNGIWTLRFTNNGGAAAEVDLYIPAQLLGNGVAADVRWIDHLDPGEVVSYPGTSDSVLAVTSYCTKNAWTAQGGSFVYDPPVSVGARSPFASPGPRRDGVQKPEIAAPGQGIAAPRGADGSGFFASNVYVLPGGLYVLSQGTSQAAPHVTGAVALILEAHPRASFREVEARLGQTARRDAWTGTTPNPDFGYGKIDAEAAALTQNLVILASLSATMEFGEAIVRWTLARESLGTQFVVERGPDPLGAFSAVSGALEGGTAFTFTDPDPDSTELWYRVLATTAAGGLEVFGPVELTPLAVAPRLWQNFPNPFAAATTLQFELDRPQEAVLEILDLSGRLVRTLSSGSRAAGRHEEFWDGLDDRGRPVVAGMYFGRLRASGGVDSRQMTLVR